MYIMTSHPRILISTRPGLGCDRLVSRAKVIENKSIAALVIAISSDASEEGGGSVVSQVIHFSTIPTKIPIVPDIPTDLPITPELPAVSPFLCSSDSESEPANELPKGHVSLGSFGDMVSRWRAKVKSHPSSPSRSLLLDTAIPSVEIPIVLIPPAPSTEIITASPTCDIPTLVISTLPAIRSCIRTTARKRTLGLRPVLTPGIQFSPEDHSHHSFENASSLSGPLTYERQQGSNYATPTSSSFVGPSRKSRQSLATSVPSTIHTIGALSPARADLLPPHKRYMDIRAYIEAETEVATVMVDGLGIELDTIVVETSFEPRLAFVESESELNNTEADDETNAEIQPEDTIEIGVDVATRIDVPDGFLMPNAIKQLD
ncbi:hypothetical protein Tco_1071586 [Tanacetum coccineum]